MKSACMMGVLMMLVAIGGLIRVADARPFAIDGHGASCQSMQTPPMVAYSADGIQSTTSNPTVVVCPLGAIALSNDTSPQAKVVVKMYTTGSMTCTFFAESDGSGVQSFPFTPTSGTYSTVSIGPIDEPVCPDNNSGRPVLVSLVCRLTAQFSSIGSIQTETTAVSSAAPSGGSMMMSVK